MDRKGTRASAACASPRSAPARSRSPAPVEFPRGCKSCRPGQGCAGSPSASRARRRSGASCRRGSRRRSGPPTASLERASRETRQEGRCLRQPAPGSVIRAIARSRPCPRKCRSRSPSSRTARGTHSSTQGRSPRRALAHAGRVPGARRRERRCASTSRARNSAGR